ncbi:anti-phage dCTP deaminase [Arthrobacter sp. 18067]|uniref:anti-phage dCTP deaminase n=1 Tax=Arthrobacter sp. 18067 TaxID=2681413 RepID=UPI00135BDB80|nr:anti-phage dCTP deaminase [Arthrobacter sp. 18067]
MITDQLINAGNDADFEIVIGIVAPIGTDLDGLFPHLESQLRQFGYSSTMIRMSELLKDGNSAVENLRLSAESCYAETLMDAGDRLRGHYESGDALAALSIARISSLRRIQGKNLDQSSRHAWILRTLKHEEEVKLLRHVYGGRFVLVGAHQDEESRAEKLRNDLSDELPGLKDIGAIASKLLARDQYDGEDEFGQQVRVTFSKADYFLNLNGNVERELERLTGLLFGKSFLTPTRDEQAIFHAYATAFRSSDPGRQVGATITTPEGDVLVTGTNEVPKAGGGNYWTDDANDRRDFKVGFDYNKRMSIRAVKEFIAFLAVNDLLSKDMLELNLDAQYKRIMSVDKTGMKQLRLTSLIEFGRVAHAEMSAITQAARSTISIQGATLYTTTFPCHMCMRLIIASGIARVVYIDPYPKSLAMDMYRDSLSQSGKMEVTPFWGASWSAFPHLFSSINRDRRDDGSFALGHGKRIRMRLAGHDPLAGARERERDVSLSIGTSIHLSPVADLDWLRQEVQMARAVVGRSIYVHRRSRWSGSRHAPRRHARP